MPDIQGMRASDLEYFVAVSLTKYGWAFNFQVSFNGGKNVSGGFVVDFVVDTAPLPTPLWVQGAYWHGAGSREKDNLQQLFFSGSLAGRYGIAVVLEEWECDTQEASDKAILKYFGRAN